MNEYGLDFILKQVELKHKKRVIKNMPNMRINNIIMKIYEQCKIPLKNTYKIFYISFERIPKKIINENNSKILKEKYGIEIYNHKDKCFVVNINFKIRKNNKECDECKYIKSCDNYNKYIHKCLKFRSN